MYAFWTKKHGKSIVRSYYNKLKIKYINIQVYTYVKFKQFLRSNYCTLSLLVLKQIANFKSNNNYKKSQITFGNVN